MKTVTATGQLNESVAGCRCSTPLITPHWNRLAAPNSAPAAIRLRPAATASVGWAETGAEGSNVVAVIAVRPWLVTLQSHMYFVL